jgi:hypothetical protein
MDVSVVLEDWLGLKPTGIRSGASFLSRLESTSSEDTA